MEQDQAQLYFEDFVQGQQFTGAARTISEKDVLGFSELTGDQHPIHYDREYARQTRFGRPIVHGLHLLSLTALGATPLSSRLHESMLAFVEQGASFRKPVFIDDKVESHIEVAGTERTPGKSWGHVRFTVRLVKQGGETVLEAFHVYRLRCRHAEKE